MDPWPCVSGADGDASYTCSAVPKTPVSQTLAHATLQQRICVRPSADYASYLADSTYTSSQTVTFSTLNATNATSLAHCTAEKILRVEYLPHLLPHSQQVSSQRLPH